jgi:hypothetical protein
MEIDGYLFRRVAREAARMTLQRTNPTPPGSYFTPVKQKDRIERFDAMGV